MSKLPATLASILPSVTMPKVMAIIQMVSDGETVKAACDQHFVNVAVFYANVNRDDDVKAMFAEALDIGNDVLADLLINIDKVHEDARMAGVISKNIQWVLERRAPKKYGAKMTVETTGSEQSKTLLAALTKAIDRIPIPTNYDAARVIDVEIVNKNTPGLLGNKPGAGGWEETPSSGVINVEELIRLGLL